MVVLEESDTGNTGGGGGRKKISESGPSVTFEMGKGCGVGVRGFSGLQKLREMVRADPELKVADIIDGAMPKTKTRPGLLRKGI